MKGIERNTTETEKELKRAAREALTREVMALMERQPQEGLHWTGTKTDLLEALHIAYVEGSIVDREGCLCTFSHITAQVCSVLHVSVPHNPRAYVARAACRKGVYRRTFLDRYLYQWHEQGVGQPLHEEVGEAFS